MFCWQARRALVESLDGRLTAPRVLHLERHLEACPACRQERDGTAWIIEEVARAGRFERTPPREALGPDFEERVLAAALGRRQRTTSLPSSRWRPVLPLPATLAVAGAVSVMLLAAVLALALRPRDAGRDGGPIARAAEERSDPWLSGATDRPGEEIPLGVESLEVLADHLAAPREIPFTIRQDLVGIRHGRFPVTTYVLEPAPREDSVVRASF